MKREKVLAQFNSRSAGWAMLALLLLTLASCSQIDAQINRYPPFQVSAFQQQTTETAKVHYVLIDIQLGGQAVENYYRKYQRGNPEIAEALADWDAGERIVNIYEFQRIRSENNDWIVVYGGTSIPIQGTDVLMQIDVGGLGNDEARIRYILADAQLGSVIDYYRQYTNDPVIAEAVARWDAGVRVTNIDQFARLNTSSGGWLVYYSDSTSLIDGMDVTLSSDQAATNPNPSGEARIRYIEADIELGNVADYYRQFTNDAEVSEALRRWDNCVRMSNPGQFERRDEGGAVGWQVVYAGTDTTINGTDVQLSGEGCQTAATSTAIISGVIYYPSEGGTGIGCPTETIYAQNVQTGELTFQYIDDGSCNFSITVPAPATYVIFGYADSNDVPGGYSYIFVCGNTCNTPNDLFPIQVQPGDVIDGIVVDYIQQGMVIPPRPCAEGSCTSSQSATISGQIWYPTEGGGYCPAETIYASNVETGERFSVHVEENVCSYTVTVSAPATYMVIGIPDNNVYNEVGGYHYDYVCGSACYNQENSYRLIPLQVQPGDHLDGITIDYTVPIVTN